MKGGIVMTNSNFLRYLETFPGKMQLAQKDSVEVRRFYNPAQAEDAVRSINRSNFNWAVPKNEGIWFKFLLFLVLVAEEQDISVNEERFSRATTEMLKQIVEKFDKKFHNGESVIKSASEITLEELMEFAKSREPLL